MLWVSFCYGLITLSPKEMRVLYSTDLLLSVAHDCMHSLTPNIKMCMSAGHEQMWPLLSLGTSTKTNVFSQKKALL